jgi:hypothetical protein
MAALTRESSFERVLSNMNRSYTTNFENIATQNEASRTISTWLKKNNKLKAVYKSMNSAELLTIESGLDALSALDSGDFVRGQEIIASEVFVQALSNFLNLLPSDPSLRKKNKMARSVRIVGSSLLITKFPGLVLEEDGKPDVGNEAKQCHLAAMVFMHSLRRLARLLQRPTTPLQAFRNSLIGYRFALRNFLSAIDAWKQIDRDRLKHSFEIAYCESYMVIWTSEKMLEKITEKLATCVDEDRPALLRERDDSAAFILSGNARLAQFRDMLGKLLGPRGSKDLLEELDAYLLSSTQAMDVQVELRSSEGEGQREGGGVSSMERNVLNASAAESIPSSSTDSGAPPPPPSPDMLKLSRVSMMTGIGENKILHELCLDPKFQLQDPLPPLRPFDSNTDGYVPVPSSYSESDLMELMQRSPAQGKDVLKTMMIKTIEDRFVANMTLSKINAVSEVRR